MRVLACALLAAVGIGIGAALTLVQNRYLPWDPMNTARMFWLWLAVVLWVVAWTVTAFGNVRRWRRR